ncbi:MAG TPA: hypothetical protein VIE17_05005 [Methylophilaceae bacterium]|jgi:hypothetical protein
MEFNAITGSLSTPAVTHLDLPPAQQGAFDLMLQNKLSGQDSTTVDTSTIDKATEIMQSYDLTNITQNQKAELATKLHDIGAISFAEYGSMFTKQLTGNVQDTQQLWDKPQNAIQQLQGTIRWQEQQTDVRAKFGLGDNKLMLNVMETLNALNKSPLA